MRAARNLTTRGCARAHSLPRLSRCILFLRKIIGSIFPSAVRERRIYHQASDLVTETAASQKQTKKTHQSV